MEIKIIKKEIKRWIIFPKILSIRINLEKKKNNNKVNKIKTNLRYFSRNWLQQNHSNKKLTKTVNTWSGHDASQ